MDELEMLNNTIHCVKMGAGQAVCEDCNLYPCDHSVVEGLCRTALNALEKQLPKKPIHIHEEYPEHLWKQNEEPCILHKDICPTCSKEIGRWLRGNYCYKCGQALDWGEQDA